MPLFLGLDLSTQQLKAVVVDEDLKIVHESAVHFDNDLSYRTTNGAIHGSGGEVASPVAMWIEALDILMLQLQKAGVNFGDIAAVSGAAQQHGSAYWSTTADDSLQRLHSYPSDPNSPNSSLPTLSEQLSKAFSIANAPIWQDSSTSAQCKNLETSIGGAQALADRTGSRAYERFTASQIAKICGSPISPTSDYDATSRISLVSSFLASLFLGQIAPIEVSDASGMNLMNVVTRKWDEQLLGICGGPDLKAKLGPEPVLGGTNLGKVASWWVNKWGFNPDCIVAPFTGDNPASIVALAAPGDALLSLGTSTTFLLSIAPDPELKPPERTTTSHLLAHPTTADGYIAMLCYKNGALAREQIRDIYAKQSWETFNDLVKASPPGNKGHLGLYFPLPEIIPQGIQGEFYFNVNKDQLSSAQKIPPGAHPRAILESQFLSILSRIKAIAPSAGLKSLVITGGSSANDTIKQLVADVLGMKVYTSTTKESAALGGAILAKYAWWRNGGGGVKGREGTLEEMLSGHQIVRSRAVEPRPEVVLEYEKLVDAYVRAEGDAVTAFRKANKVNDQER